MMRITWSVGDNAPENDENHIVSSFSGALSPTDQMDVKVTNAYTHLICTEWMAMAALAASTNFSGALSPKSCVPNATTQHVQHCGCNEE